MVSGAAIYCGFVSECVTYYLFLKKKYIIPPLVDCLVRFNVVAFVHVAVVVLLYAVELVST